MTRAPEPVTFPARPEASAGLETERIRAAIGARLFEQVEAPPKIGRFTLLEPIGAGGMGSVYAAYDPQLDRRIALKLLRPSAEGDDGRAAARLLREAQAMARVTHPNVLVVHEAGVHEGAVYIAMEFVPGGTLTTWCERNAIGGRGRFARLLDLFGQAARGLAAAHEAGLVHRDLKPANLLVDDRDRLRVADFGLARPSAEVDDAPSASAARAACAKVRAGDPTPPEPDPERLTATGAIAGTPAYMPPEQVEGRSDARSDQWSLCASFWEAAYGERAFAADTFAASIVARLEGRLVVPAGRSADVPGWFRELLGRGLSPDPAARFRDMAALFSALEHGRAGARRQRRLVLAVAAIGGLGGLGWAAWADTPVDTTSPCEAARTGLDEIWNPERAAELRAAFEDTGRGSTGIERVFARVELFAERWRDGAAAACERARTRGEVSESPTEVLALPSRAMGCYRDARVQLDAVLAALPEAKAASHAVILVQALPPLIPCEVDAPGPAIDLGAGREAAEALARATAANSMRDGEATREHLARARAALADHTTPNLATRLHLLEASDLYNRGELEASRRAARAGLDTAEAGDDPTDEVFAWLHLADAVRSLDDLDAADFYVDRAHARAVRGGDPPWLRARIDLGRAAVASLRGDHLAAYESFVRARDRLAEVYGTESSSYARILRDAALAARQAGRFGEAIGAGTEAVDVCRRVFGDEHAETVRATVTLASMLTDAGDLARAIELFDEASALLLETDDLGAGDRFTYLVLHAQALGNARRFADAQARLDLAAEVGRTGGLPPERIDGMLALLRAGFALDAGDHATVVATLEPLRTDPPGDSELARRENGITICLNLALAHAGSGDASSARPIADDCWRRLGALEVRDPVRHGSAYRYLGEIEHRAGRADEALEAYAEAIAMLESDGSAPLVAGEAHLGLAEVLLDAGDHAGASEHLARARTAAAEAGAGEDQLALEAFAARLHATASP